jgi:hypothetical protein
MLPLLLCLLATIAVHRIWHYEDIFAPLRSSLGAKLFLDPTMSGLWIAPLVCSLTLLPEGSGFIPLAVFSCYTPLRGLVWLDEYFNPKATCSPCEAKRKKFEEEMKDLRSFEKRVILIGADQEQANWLAQKHKTWCVILVGEGDSPNKLWKNVRYRKIQHPQDVTQVIMMGGNATLVTRNVAHQDPWKTFVLTAGHMKGTAWVHVGTGFSGLPAHHKSIPPSEPLDQHL